KGTRDRRALADLSNRHGSPPSPIYTAPSTIASASISTSISGATSRVTATSVLAGRMSRNTSPCARPTRSQSAMSVTYMRVRTTSASEAPACASARSMFLSAWTACTCASPMPTIRPSGPVAVVPDTWMVDPTRTPRECPTIGSHGAPLDTFCRPITCQSPAKEVCRNLHGGRGIPHPARGQDAGVRREPMRLRGRVAQDVPHRLPARDERVSDQLAMTAPRYGLRAQHRGRPRPSDVEELGQRSLERLRLHVV